MSKTNNLLLKGTLLLTLAGLLSRIMGFFYKIFLAGFIGAEGMGIYQLIFPVYSVCFSLCASGIETAISKLTAAKCATGNSGQAIGILKTGLLLSLTLSLGCSFVIFRFSSFLSLYFLKEPRCGQLLRILAVTIPFGTMQSCICGYYLGVHKAFVPSIAQLVEQTFRIGCVFLLQHIYLTNKMEISPAIAVIGLVFGEICSFLFTITCLSYQPSRLSKEHANIAAYLPEIFSLAAPLTTSRILINLLVSLEAVTIPYALKAYGMEHSQALSIYGILNGMVLPLILFPNALTGSVSLMLLPTVSESQAMGNLEELKHTVKTTFSFCLLLGGLCTLFFLLFGDLLGSVVFSSTLAGSFITTLSWLCPFLYLNTTLNSVLNGLGKTSVTFFNGIAGLFIRIVFLWFFVPQFGIKGHLIGLLLSQLFVTFSGCTFLHKYFLRSIS